MESVKELTIDKQCVGDTKQTNKEREALFDNLKVILIFLVVFGHAIESFASGKNIYSYVYIIIYSFHMPLFIVISGYFSKNLDKSREGAFKKYLVPYLVFSTLYAVIIDKKEFVSIFIPSWTYWFLLSMFFWKLLLKDLVKIRFIVLTSILLSLYCGIFGNVNTFLSISRTLTFLPFFLIGYFFNDDIRVKIEKIPRIVAIIVCVLVSIGVCWFFKNGGIPRQIFFGSAGYAAMNLSNLQGVITRFAITTISIIMCICIFRIAPRTKRIYTKFGAATITIYLLHPYIIKIIEMMREKLPILNEIPAYIMLFGISIVSVGILLLFGNKYINKAYNKFIETIDSLIFRRKEC